MIDQQVHRAQPRNPQPSNGRPRDALTWSAQPPNAQPPSAAGARWVEEADEADAEPHICRGTD